MESNINIYLLNKVLYQKYIFKQNFNFNFNYTIRNKNNIFNNNYFNYFINSNLIIV